MKSEDLERGFKEGIKEKKTKCFKKMNMKEMRNMNTHICNWLVSHSAVSLLQQRKIEWLPNILLFFMLRWNDLQSACWRTMAYDLTLSEPRDSLYFPYCIIALAAICISRTWRSNWNRVLQMGRNLLIQWKYYLPVPLTQHGMMLNFTKSAFTWK